MMHRFLTTLCLLCLTAVTSADVIVVDEAGGAGADFTALQPAIDAAQDGDILLVRDGLYDPFSITGKGLVVTADTNARIRLNSGTLSVSGIPFGSDVSLAGIESDSFMFVGQLVHAPVLVHLSSENGSISLRDCSFWSTLDSGAGFTVESGTVAVMSDCTVTAQTAIGGSAEGTLRVDSSAVYASRCTFTGPLGEPGTPFSNVNGGPGGTGAVVWNGTLFLSDSVVTGGRGGDGFGAFGCGNGGDGGTGLSVDGSLGGVTTSVSLRDSPVFSGAGGAGAGTLGSCTDGVPGIAIDWIAGGLSVEPGAGREIHVPSPIREFQPFSLNVTGADGDMVFALLSFAPWAVVNSPNQAMVYPLPPIRLRYLGTMPGAASTPLVMPGVFTVVEGLRVSMQAAFIDPVSMKVRTSGGLDVVALDSAF